MANVDAEDFDAATALVAFQQYSHTSDTNKVPATHTNTIRVLPLRPKCIVLDPMDKVFARSMQMSEEEMIAQNRIKNGSDAGKDSGAEDDLPITKLAEKHNEKKKATVTAGTKSDEAPMDVSASEDDESEPDGDDKSAWKQLIGSVEQFDMPFKHEWKHGSQFCHAFLILPHTRLKKRMQISCWRVKVTGSCLSTIKDAEAFRANSRNKNKAWSIRIHDKSMTDSKESTGTKKKKTANSATEVELSMSLTSDAALLVAIQKKHHCNACQAPCYVLANGDHYHYDDADMNLWVTLASCHSATIDKTPDEILTKLGEKSLCQKAEARRTMALPPATPANPVVPALDAIQQMVLMMGAMTPLVAGMLHGRDRSPACHSSSSLAKRSRELESSPAAPDSSPLKAPVSKNVDLDEWLPQVDAHVERGK
ncbi:hypothetical protein BT96DRAFT_941719 [Gymnopus androsaceus JB14]|uniref:Uncharacterized protein n=1 Tax=Gymnopus androsaceus JB14 TaxID=1447944 RepID=A0A6A4HF78_9AGAR|nr:hypothetical protein BT96DRAFT_941719 [Gymnopus androsaceus JB14]